VWVCDGVYRGAGEAEPLSSVANFLGKSGEPGRNRTVNPQIKSRVGPIKNTKELSNSPGQVCRTCHSEADRRNPGATNLAGQKMMNKTAQRDQR
jgi:hypothetical protein